MKSVKFTKAVIAACLCTLAVSCSSVKPVENEAVKMTMSSEAKAYIENYKKTTAPTFTEENFPANLEQLKNRSTDQKLPDVKTVNKIGLEMQGNEKVYTLSNGDYENIVLYIHGGAFAFGISSLHVEFCDLLVEALNAKVYMPLYPLTPQATYKDVYPMLKAVYAELLQQNKTIYVMGDSAGGALTLSLVQQLRDEGVKLPAKVVLMGPFVDGSMRNPDIKAIEPRDAMLQPYGLRECTRLFGTGSFDDPLLCPLNGEMKGLPDTLLFNATDEILEPDGKILYQKMKKAGVNIKWVLAQGFWHVFPIFNIPERAECVQMIKDFVEGKEIVVKEDVAIAGKNGTLRGYLRAPESAMNGKKKCPLIVMMHGLDDWCEFDLIKKQAVAYADEGYAVLTVDFDGHGYSDGKFYDMTISKELEDAEDIMKYAQSLKFASEIDLVGHSQGGAVAAITAAKYSKKLNKLVLLAPGGMIADDLRSGHCFGQDFDVSNPPEKFVVFGDEIGKNYVLDAMKLDLYKMAEGFSGHNILLVAGGADPLVKAEVIQKYQKLYSKDGANLVNLLKIENAPHDFHDFEPELIEQVLFFLKN